jgi:hypothetical protein
MLHRFATAAVAVIGMASSLQWPPASAATALDVNTSGGAVVGARILRVTSLADAGPGSLRAALGAKGPRVVVFDVAGYIELASDLPIENGEVTIAGQTAPGSGVILRGGSLKIHASDVMVEHIAVYAGSTTDQKRAEDRDGITIYGRYSKKTWIGNIVLRNVSVGWGVDENIGINGRVDGVRIENSLIAEGLKHGGHPKGLHSMNLLVGSPVKTLLILGNVFATSNQRSSRLTQGNIVEFLNNFVYGFGKKATHIDSNQQMAGAARIDVIGNVYRRTADSRCRQPMVQISETFFDSQPPSEVYLADNSEISPALAGCAPADGTDATIAKRLSGQPLARVSSWRLSPADSLYPGILDRVGSHPAHRNPIDARILKGIRDATAHLIDDESEVGGWPPIEAVSERAVLPLGHSRIDDAKDLLALTTWLCERAKKAGGDQNACD